MSNKHCARFVPRKDTLLVEDAALHNDGVRKEDHFVQNDHARKEDTVRDDDSVQQGVQVQALLVGLDEEARGRTPPRTIVSLMYSGISVNSVVCL